MRRLSHAEDPACCYESRDEARLAEIISSSASPHLAVHPSQLLCVASEGEKIKKKSPPGRFGLLLWAVRSGKRKLALGMRSTELAAGT